MLFGRTLEPSAALALPTPHSAFKVAHVPASLCPKARRGKKCLQSRVIRAGAGRRRWGPTKGFVIVSEAEPCLTPRSCAELLVSYKSLVFFCPFTFAVKTDQEKAAKPSKVTCAARRAGQSTSQARPPMLQTYASLTVVGQMYTSGLHRDLRFV